MQDSGLEMLPVIEFLKLPKSIIILWPEKVMPSCQCMYYRKQEAAKAISVIQEFRATEK